MTQHEKRRDEMTLHDLLTDLSGDPGPTDYSPDLRRGRRALTRRRTRVAAVVGGTGLAAAAGWSALPGGSGTAAPDVPVTSQPTHAPASPRGEKSRAEKGRHEDRLISLQDLSDGVDPGADDSGPSGVQHDLFTYPPLGHGYTETDDQGPAVQFTRPGQHVESYLDSPVLMLEDKKFPMRFGDEVVRGGATLYDQREHPVNTVSIQLDSGDWLQLQYPLDSGLTSQEVYDFLLGVQVEPGARGAVG